MAWYVMFGRSESRCIDHYYVQLSAVMFNLRIFKITCSLIILAIGFLKVYFSLYYLNIEKSLDKLETEEERQTKKILISRSEYLERIEHLDKLCTRIDLRQDVQGLTENRDLLEHILVDARHHVLYCYVPKVACTNWKRIFMVLTGATNTTDVLSIPAHLAHSRHILMSLNNYTNGDVEYLLNTYTKFLFVRHPFERLLSAFRNKLEQNYIKSKYFQARVGRYIVKRYRVKPKNVSLQNGDDVTFEEFTAYLSKSHSAMLNEHWKPVHNLCEPCRIKYDFIGKYETLITDSNFILRSIGITNVRFPHTIKAATTYNEIKKYFSSLSPIRIKELYDIYEHDFKLFSYDLGDLLGYEVG